ncbi:MAG: nucleoside monophosphate kinase, partial [Alphaproteobacteria bacterium]|nr:nucleoside monophosphate kinase [Alphaproteobacteria bacterium]
MKHTMIVMMGGQGAGKGSIANIMKTEHEYKHIESGALFRTLPADSEIAKIMARGELVPDSELFKLMESQITDDVDIILDGFPRTLPQAQWLVEKYANKFNIHVLYLDLSEELMIFRINKRINEGGGRADDADTVAVRRRLDTFWKTTVPAIEWLRTAPGIKFSDIDASQTLSGNMEQIHAAMK